MSRAIKGLDFFNVIFEIGNKPLAFCQRTFNKWTGLGVVGTFVGISLALYRVQPTQLGNGNMGKLKSSRCGKRGWDRWMSFRLNLAFEEGKDNDKDLEL